MKKIFKAIRRLTVIEFLSSLMLSFGTSIGFYFFPEITLFTIGIAMIISLIYYMT